MVQLYSFEIQENLELIFGRSSSLSIQDKFAYSQPITVKRFPQSYHKSSNLLLNVLSFLNQLKSCIMRV